MKKEHPKPEKMIVKSSQRRPFLEPDVELDLPAYSQRWFIENTLS
ncbi:MAG: hypothetical protein ACYDEF_13145 [Methanosarcina sp.]